MQTNRHLRLVAVVMLLVVALPAAFAQDDELPVLVMAARTGMHPEGIEWDAANERFLTSSNGGEGTIFAIADDGTVTPFIEDDDLVSTIGIHIDRENARLLVCNSDLTIFNDPEAAGVAQLGSYDLNTGERLYFVDLGALLGEGRHFCNDVTSDADGNAYVTDSLSPVIYQVTPDGEASIFIEDEQLIGEGFGLNGIEYHPDGYLLVAVSGTGSLYKIPLDDPQALAQVELGEAFSADSIVLHPNGNLIAVVTTFNGASRANTEVLEVASNDDWEAAEIINRVPTDPDVTTAAVRDEAVYVVNSHFSEFFSGQQVDEFEILRIDFER